MNCSACGKEFDGNEIVTFAWLQEHAPEVARWHTPKTLFEGKLLPKDEWPDTEYTCGTICPHCGHPNDAPGFVEGDDVPHQGPDGEWYCATRYMPPRQVYHIGSIA